MNLKLDENLGQSIADLLRQGGHDVSTVHEQGFQGFSDRGLIQICRAEARCLVTLDLDFANPLVFNPAEFHGIAVLRLPPRTIPADLRDASFTLTGGLRNKSIEGKLWVVQRGRIREHAPETQNGH